MSQSQWQSLLEGEAAALAQHLTLERVTASKSGEKITVYFSSDLLVEERPFLAVQRSLRKNFAPIYVSLVIRSPQLKDDFLADPQKYAPFILRSVGRKHPAGAPLIEGARFECKGDVLSVLLPQDIAPGFLSQLRRAHNQRHADRREAAPQRPLHGQKRSLLHQHIR